MKRPRIHSSTLRLASHLLERMELGDVSRSRSRGSIHALAVLSAQELRERCEEVPYSVHEATSLESAWIDCQVGYHLPRACILFARWLNRSCDLPSGFLAGDCVLRFPELQFGVRGSRRITELLTGIRGGGGIQKFAQLASDSHAAMARAPLLLCGAKASTGLELGDSAGHDSRQAGGSNSESASPSRRSSSSSGLGLLAASDEATGSPDVEWIGGTIVELRLGGDRRVRHICVVTRKFDPEHLLSTELFPGVPEKQQE